MQSQMEMCSCRPVDCVLGDRDGEDSVPGDGVCERGRGIRLPGPPRSHEGIYCYVVIVTHVTIQ